MQKHTTVKIGNTTVKAEIADSLLKRMKGLMFRQTLPKKEGMLFVFNNPARYKFWMSGMNFSVDMIWISDSKRVVDITRNAQPCLVFCKPYCPKKKVKYVLEVNAEFAKKHKVRIGSKASFNL